MLSVGRAQRILGVSPPLDRDQLHRAWLRELKRWHPDHNSDPQAAERTAEINAAYEVLRASLERGPAPGPEAGGGRSRAPGFAASPMWRPNAQKLATREEVAVPLPTAVVVTLWAAFGALLAAAGVGMIVAGSTADMAGLHLGKESPGAVAAGVAILLLGILVPLSALPRFRRLRWSPYPLRVLAGVAFLSPAVAPDHTILLGVLVLAASGSAGLLMTVAGARRRLEVD